MDSGRHTKDCDLWPKGLRPVVLTGRAKVNAGVGPVLRNPGAVSSAPAAIRSACFTHFGLDTEHPDVVPWALGLGDQGSHVELVGFVTGRWERDGQPT